VAWLRGGNPVGRHGKSVSFLTTPG
jgi:hypothetical protein